VGADLVVLLSDVDGLYTANPNEDPDATRFDVVNQITPQMEAAAGDAGSGLSKGGMKTKLLAARTAMAGGAGLVITQGGTMRPLSALANGAPATWFTAQDDPNTARKRWIAAMKPNGVLTLDAGAAKALIGGKSLLPAGVTAVSGSFQRGDPVVLADTDGATIAQGLSRYSSQEAQKIKGQHSSEIEALLGYPGRAALVHRDDMVL